MPVTVTAPGDSAWASVNNYNDFNGNGSKDNPYVVVVNSKSTDAVTFSLSDDDGYYTDKELTKVSSADSSVIKVNEYKDADLTDAKNTPGKVTLTYLKSGETTLKMEYSRYNVATKTRENTSKDIYFKVVETKSVLTVSGTEVGEGKLSTSSPVVKTITLSADNPEAELGGKLTDPQYKAEALKYSGVAARGTAAPTNIDATIANYNSSDLKISGGKVTATAQALSGVEKYYDILVYNNLGNAALTGDATNGKLKLGVIRVITRRDGTNFTKVTATVGTVTYNTTAEGKAIVEITGASTNTAKAPTPAYITVYYSNEKLASRLNVETKSLNLNVGETGTVVASGSALSYASNDTDVATVDAKTGVVTAVKAGVATITVTDAGDANYQSGSKDVTVYVYGASDNTVAKPAKVTGLKVSNKKGAYVSVKWTSQGKNINYRVYKKVGNGKWVGKNVAGNKTTPPSDPGFFYKKKSDITEEYKDNEKIFKKNNCSGTGVGYGDYSKCDTSAGCEEEG